MTCIFRQLHIHIQIILGKVNSNMVQKKLDGTDFLELAVNLFADFPLTNLSDAGNCFWQFRSGQPLQYYNLYSQAGERKQEAMLVSSSW